MSVVTVKPLLERTAGAQRQLAEVRRMLTLFPKTLEDLAEAREWTTAEHVVIEDVLTAARACRAIINAAPQWLPRLPLGSAPTEKAP